MPMMARISTIAGEATGVDDRLRSILRPLIPGRIRRSMQSGLNRITRLRDEGMITVQKARTALTGKRSKHIVVCGPSRAGKTIVKELLSALPRGKIYAPLGEDGALAVAGRVADLYVTHSCFDVLRYQEIIAAIGEIRDVYFVVMVRDPRALIATRKSHSPKNYQQGYDYQSMGPIHGKKSYSNIGVVDLLLGAQRLESELPQSCSLVRYEDLVKDPERVVSELLLACDLGNARTGSLDVIPPLVKKAISDAALHQMELDIWLLPQHRERVLRQLHLSPELEELAIALGYPAASAHGLELKQSAPLALDGTIIAFHTEDEVYRKEAERFTRQLDRLGLKYDITVVQKRGEWVENCAMKPEFLLSARRRVRGPLLYIDVDAFVHSDPWPYLSLYDGDMAAYVHSDGDLMSGTLFINDTQKAVDLLEAWVAQQLQEPKNYDQRVLQAIVEEDERDQAKYQFQRLPPNFCYVGDKQYNYLYGAVVIEHFQASRLAKRGSRGGFMARRVAELDAG